jgi:hypothetical protein
MRGLIIIAGAALALGACGNNDQSDNTQNVDENLSAEDIVSNDVTAIDAVTGDAANMAADVNYAETENLLANTGGNSTRPSAQRPTAKPLATRPADEPATNSAAPSNSTSE